MIGEQLYVGTEAVGATSTSATPTRSLLNLSLFIKDCITAGRSAVRTLG
jgi:hypothetical protein